MKNQSATTSAENSASISALDSLLQGERSAVATYTNAQRHLAGRHAADLETNRSCHAARVTALTNRIVELGGKPSTSGGLWVGFTKAVEGTASVLGEGAIIAALEQGEDIGLADYRAPSNDLDPVSRTLVVDDLLQAQMRTHDLMSAIQKSR